MMFYSSRTLLLIFYHFAIYSSGLPNQQCKVQLNILELRPNPDNIDIITLTSQLQLGEQPFWDVETNSLYFLDIFRATFYRYSPTENQLYCTSIFPGNVNGIIPFKGLQNQFMISYDTNLAILYWDGIHSQSSVRILGLIDPNPAHMFPYSVIDDMKVAPNGGLLIYIVPRDSPAMTDSTLYQILHRQIKPVVPHLDFGNGIAINPNNNELYFGDTNRKLVFKANFDEITCTVRNIRVLLSFIASRIPGSPDSMTIDTEGFLWIACTQGSMIIKVDPNTGIVLRKITLPALGVSNVAFGRCPNSTSLALDCLYVTTGAVEIGLPVPGYYDGRVFCIRNLGSQGFPGIRLSKDVLPYF